VDRSLGLGELLTAQGFAGGPGGVQRVGLGPVAAGGPLGPIQLHHPLVMSIQESGQAGAVAAGALDRPHPQATVLVGQLQQLLVASRSGRHRHGGGGRAGGHDHHGGGVGVLVGVDADDDLDGVCQHGHRVGSLPGR
jgi:hypothetical protein